MRRHLGGLVIGLAAACAGGGEPVDTDLGEDLVPLEPPPAGLGFQVSMTGEVAPYSEVWLCSVSRLQTTSVSNVSWVEWQQNANTHHMTVSTTFSGDLDMPDGMYDCDKDIYVGEFMSNQVMMFGNQGSPSGTLHLPDGVAATLPAAIPVVYELHFVNTTDKPMQLFSRLNAWTIPDREVQDGIWGGSVRDEHIVIPPKADAHREWTRCVMNRDVEVQFLAGHMHERGVEFTIAPFDGTTVGEVFFRNDDWHDPKITQFAPPMVLKEGEGFEFACTWKNLDDVEVNYGELSTDEMCNMAIVHTPFDLGARCEVVESSDGELWVP